MTAAAAASSADMEAMFVTLKDALERTSEQQETVRAACKSLGLIDRQLQFQLQKVQSLASHSPSSSTSSSSSSSSSSSPSSSTDDATDAAAFERDVAVITDAVAVEFRAVAKAFADIAAIIASSATADSSPSSSSSATPSLPPSPERYRHLWRHSLQSFVFHAAYAHFLSTHTLLSQDECAELFGLSDHTSATITNATPAVTLGLDVEDYLLGLCALPKELSRLCVNQVTAGNYTLPHTIAAFVSDLYAGFRLLNLRNDGLRRKFDGIKYDLQKIEDVLYDVKIRQLKADAGEK